MTGAPIRANLVAATDARAAMRNYVFGKRWTSLVERYGTPIVITDLDLVRAQCVALKGVFPDARLLYSMKANYNPHVVKAIMAEGFGIDAVSPNEVDLAQRLRAPASRAANSADIFYVENNMTDGEMREAAASGVRLIVGSLSRLQRFCAEFPNRTVGVRINGDVGGSHHEHAFTAGPTSKFGIHYTQLAEALETAQAANVRIDTVHQHIGSGWLDHEAFLEAAEILLREGSRFPDLQCLDFGGGFGVPYRPEERSLDMSHIAAELRKRVAQFDVGRRTPVEIALEFGRYVVAEAAVLLSRVNTVKVGSDGRSFLGLDTGLNHLIRPALYDAHHEILNASSQSGPEQPYDVCGNICESADFFARGRVLPETQEGDIVAIMNVGAYGLAMGSNYNLRALPTEVVLDRGQPILSRRRQTLTDLLSQFVL
jgi:diaminopimelate decarboxylase